MEVVNRSVLQKSKNKLTLFVILQDELYFTSVQIFKISIYFNQKATTDAFFVTTFIVVLFYGRWEVLRVASPLFQRLFSAASIMMLCWPRPRCMPHAMLRSSSSIHSINTPMQPPHNFCTAPSLLQFTNLVINIE